MSKMNLYIPDELERGFRIAIINKIGTKKGSINQAVEEAIKLWMAEAKKRKKEVASTEVKDTPEPPPLETQSSEKNAELEQVPVAHNPPSLPT